MNLMESIKRGAREYREKLAREGYALIDCDACDGSGYARHGYSDTDAHGSFWVAGLPCPLCFAGRRQVPISKEEQAAAMRRWLAEHDTASAEE